MRLSFVEGMSFLLTAWVSIQAQKLFSREQRDCEFVMWYIGILLLFALNVCVDVQEKTIGRKNSFKYLFYH